MNFELSLWPCMPNKNNVQSVGWTDGRTEWWSVFIPAFVKAGRFGLWYGEGVVIPPANKVWGVYRNHPVCPSVYLSVCLSVCSLRVRAITSYSLVRSGYNFIQLLSMTQGCVIKGVSWPWSKVIPPRSRSRTHILEIRVRAITPHCQVRSG